MSDPAILACAAEAAIVGILAVLVLFTVPRAFRLFPPESAGAFVRGAAREHLSLALLAAGGALAARLSEPRKGWGPPAHDAAIGAILLAAWLAAAAFESARVVAMRPLGPGEAVHGDAVLRAHRRLRLFLVLCAAGATAAAAAVARATSFAGR